MMQPQKPRTLSLRGAHLGPLFRLEDNGCSTPSGDLGGPEPCGRLLSRAAKARAPPAAVPAGLLAAVPAAGLAAPAPPPLVALSKPSCVAASILSRRDFCARKFMLAIM